MDKEIEDIKRRAGLLTEAEEPSAESAYKSLDFILRDETKFLGNLGRVLARALSPVHRKEVLTVINNRTKALTDFHKEKVGDPQQEHQQNQQQQKFQKAEQEKAGGPRRP
jgi:hypothetical protein